MIRAKSAGLRLLGVVLLAVGGLAMTTPAPATPAAQGVMAAGVLSAQDKAWLIGAHQSNLAQTAAGNDALRYALSQQIEIFGQFFAEDHTRFDRTVRQLARSHGVRLPSAPSAAQQASLASVKRNTDSAYDSAWVRAEYTGYRKALASATKEVSDGRSRDVVAAARTAASLIKGNLGDLNDIATFLGLPIPTWVNGGTGGQAARAASAPPPGTTTVTSPPTVATAAARPIFPAALALTIGGLVLLLGAGVGAGFGLRRRPARDTGLG
jgi:putative membrane protein